MPMRRPAASPSSPSMDHRAPLSPAVVPPKKRRSPRSPKPAATIVPVPRLAALPVPPCVPHQIHAPPAAAGAADADADSLMLLAHTAVSHADAEAEAEAAAASPPPAPAPAHAAEKLRSSPSLQPPAAAYEEKPYAPPLPLPPLTVDENPSSFSMGHGDAATKGTAGDRKKKAACPQPQGNAGRSSKGHQRGGGVAWSAAGALASPPQAGGDEELELGEIPGDDEELELGEIPPEKPAPGCNEDSAAHESSMGKDEIMTAGEEETKTTIAGEPPAGTGSSAHHAAPAVVVGRAGKAAAEMSAAEDKRMREVFVGGLSRDARVEDVRAALSAAGQITEVRMIRDRTTRKNKDFCFVAYRDAAMASKAIAEFHDVKICGQPCRLAVPEGYEKANKIAQRDPIIEDYNRIYEQRQAVHSSYITSWDPHAWYENNTYAIPASSYVVSPVGYYIPMHRYHNGNRVYLPPPDLNHGLAGPRGRSQMVGQSGSSRPAEQPHRSRN